MYKFTEKASLLPYNTFGIDVTGALIAEYETLDDLQEVLALPQVKTLMQQERQAGRLPFWHVGEGSNLLFTQDYQGVILHCQNKGIRVSQTADEKGLVKLAIAAGTIWDEVCAYCAEKNYYGAENLSFIPGETGAAAVQNIGAYGVEIKDLIDKVTCWDVDQECLHVFTVEEMAYGYRESRLKHFADKARYIVISVEIKVSILPVYHLDYAGLKAALSSEKPTAKEIREAVIHIRQGKLPDPKILGNAGSFFKNPVVTNDVYEALATQYEKMPHYKVDDMHIKIPAGWMIEQCGWKGRNLGRAGVYENQSLVLVNRGGATPDEIVSLCQTIIRDVEQRFGIRIEPEVNLI